MTDIRTVLSIAGSDSSGGAGIQADIKTIIANGCYAMTAITALTAQNTMDVKGIQAVTPEFLKLQLEACYEDIKIDAIKIGMVKNAKLIEVIADFLEKAKIANVVIDPVMISTSGKFLLQMDSTDMLIDRLLPLAKVITPNIPEAEFICSLIAGESFRINSASDMEKAANIMYDRFGQKVDILVKGGHSINDANDLLIADGKLIWIDGERIQTENTHGTGCTLSSAIASNLAKGFTVIDSIKRAKMYITNAMKHEIDLGKGSGPLNHGWNIGEF